jgi:D-lactate dehydrogenase (cytochrome)
MCSRTGRPALTRFGRHATIPHMEGLTCTRIADPSRIHGYLADESAAFHGRADELFLPESEAQVIEVVCAAADSGTALTISAGGTSITGSRVPMAGGSILSIERLVRCEHTPPDGFETVEGAGFSIKVNAGAKRAIVPPAVTLSQLDSVLARFGLAYPPDPTELSAQMAGTVATNASGGRSFHYGPTRAWVERLRVVLPNGEVTDLRRKTGTGTSGANGVSADVPVPAFRPPDGEGRTVHVPLPTADEYPMPQTKNAAGLYLAPGMEPVDLFIGCEGLLGVVTEVEVGLITRPEHTLTVVAYFDARDDALDFVHAGVVHQAPFDYLSLEYFDGRSLDFMRPAHPDVPQAAAAVLFELPYEPPEENSPYPDSDTLTQLDAELARYRAIANWALPASRREDIRRFRHSLPEAVNDFVRRHVGKIGSDMAVPHDRFREMMDAYEREGEASGVGFVIFGHVGDDHVHLNFLPETAEQAARCKAAYTRLAQTAVALGGTISAEHGVGKKTITGEDGTAMPYLQIQYGLDGLRAIARVKNALDPQHILNVGNMVPGEMLR